MEELPKPTIFTINLVDGGQLKSLNPLSCEGSRNCVGSVSQSVLWDRWPATEERINIWGETLFHHQTREIVLLTRDVKRMLKYLLSPTTRERERDRESPLTGEAKSSSAQDIPQANIDISLLLGNIL